MARPGNRWLLSIILVIEPNILYNMTRCLAQPVGPPAPSPPECHIPYEEYEGIMVRSAIQCIWDPGPPSKTPSNYTLHWESADSSEQWVRGSNTSAEIQAKQVFSHSELSVWVRAQNRHGSASSPESTFNTASIMRPATPTIISHISDPLEIYWESKCSKQGLSEDHCQVRHRVAPDQGWPKEDEGLHGSYSLEDVLPYSWYEFQVRCVCFGSTLSDWSQVYKVESQGAGPVGLLDVWSDCKRSPQSSECSLMWKMPPRSQARGEILGYVATLSHGDGTVTMLNASTIAMPTNQLTCDEKLCHLKADLTNVTAVTVSAYTAYGATTPARLEIPLSAQEKKMEALQLKMNSEELTLSWKPPSQQHINSQLEYVVQYKQVGAPPTKGFDWIRLEGSQSSANITGQFEKYIAYQVALFSVAPNGSSDHISSAVGYAHQGIPPKVPSVELVSVNATSATLSWEAIPLAQRRGVIVCYQIGVGSQRVYNVSEPQDRIFLLKPLDPGQNYNVWIRAMTKAGPGPNSTLTFKTEGLGGLDISFMYYLTILFVVALVIPFISFPFIRRYSWVIKDWIGLKKVADPSTSHVFQKLNNQINSSVLHLPPPVEEPDPVLCHLEIVKPSGPQGSMEGVMDQGRWAGSGNTAAREECYSKVTDSDEEMDIFPSHYEKRSIPTMEGVMDQGLWAGSGNTAAREECYSKVTDSDEEMDIFPSNYEKHFFPTAIDIM